MTETLEELPSTIDPAAAGAAAGDAAAAPAAASEQAAGQGAATAPGAATAAESGQTEPAPAPAPVSEEALAAARSEAGSIPVQDADVSQEIGALLVARVAGAAEVRYQNGAFSRTFAYNLQVDGHNVGSQANDLTVKVATDLSDDNKDAYKYARPKDLVVVLPRGGSFTGDVRRLLQIQAHAARAAGSQDEARTALAEHEAAEAEGLRIQLADELEGLLADARYGTCMQDITDDARMVGGGAERLQAAVRIMAENSYTFLSALKNEFSSETVYAESLHAKSADGEPLPMYCMLALQEIRSIQATCGTCMVGGIGESSLEAHLTDENYGWPAEASRQAVGVLALNDRISCSRNGKPLEGAQLALALSQGAELGEVKIRIVKAVPHEQLSALKKAFRKATGLSTESNEARGIADNFQGELQKRLKDARKARNRVQGFPFADAYEQAVSELTDIAVRNRDWFEERAPKEADKIHELLERIRKMASFATGEEGEAFDEARAFLNDEATNIAALPVCTEAATELKDLLTDPDCYERPDAAARARELEGELREHVDAGVVMARSRAHMELYEFSGEFHGGAEYQGAPEEARQKADALLKSCADDIDASTQVVAIQGMVERFKDLESDRLYAFVAPEDAEDAEGAGDGSAGQANAADASGVPAQGAGTSGRSKPGRGDRKARAVTYRKVARPKDWKRTLATTEDVDEFVAALREQLAGYVEDGTKIIM